MVWILGHLILVRTGFAIELEFIWKAVASTCRKNGSVTPENAGSEALLESAASPLPGTAALRPARQAGPQRSEEELDGQRYNRGGGQ